jgi:hypothetical protein
MASITAIELGTDTCAFARTSTRRGEVHLSAAEVLDPAAFPGMDAFTIAARQARRSMGLPRKCRVVLWGLPDGANRKDAAVKPLLAPLTNAGFRVDRVVTPCNALAALARLKTSRGEGSTCWLAINRGGVAIVVVRPGKLLFAHSFIWDSQIGASGSQARLLQRYSLVSFLAPEVKRAMAEARKSGTPVNAVVTCGNLPDLRSLTMPLIEELDVEVETLDSFEGLIVKPQVAEKIGDSAPAIRLACAAAIARGTRPWDPAKKRSHQRAVSRYVAAAAIVLAIAGVAYQWYAKPRNVAPPPFTVKVPPPVGVPAKRPESNPPAATKAPVVTAALPPAKPPIVSVPLAKSTPPPPAASVPAKKPESNPPAVTKAPVVTAALPPAKPPIVSVPPGRSTPPPPVVTKTPAVSVQSTNIPPKGGNYTAGTGASAPALSDPAKKPESNPPAVSVTAKRPESNPPAVTKAPTVSPQSTYVPPNPSSAKAAASPPKPATPANTVPSTTIRPLFMLPLPNLPAPRASAPTPPVASTNLPPKGGSHTTGTATSAPPAPSVPAKGPESRGALSDPAKKPESKGAVSVTAKKPESNRPALNTPAVSADKPDARVPPGTAAPRGQAPPLLKDPVPRVSAILVSRDRRFATVDGGQIVGIGDLLGRRTVVAMDERSVVFQEPSGMQIRIGLGGRLLGVDRVER